MHLIYVNEIGSDYKGQKQYEFVFSESTEIDMGDWFAVPASSVSRSKSPDVEYVDVVGLLKDIPGIKINVPEGAFYVFPDVSHFFGKTLKGTFIKDANDFSMYLLSEANVATVTGDAFGNPNCIRFSYATSEDLLTEALRRIKEAVA